MTVSAAVVLALGAVHLVYTFWSAKLAPRDAALRQRMEEVSPVITRQTTMWKAWIGFNATHSLGMMLFGLVYGYLALSQSGFLFGSTFLLAIGLGMLLSLTVVARLYFFRTPFRGVCLALACYVGSVVFSR